MDEIRYEQQFLIAVLNKDNKLLFLVLLLISSSATGGNADLSIELEFNETNGIVLEQQGEFTARITNNGPDIAAENSGFQFPIVLSSDIIQDNGNFTPDVQFAAGSQNNNQLCFFTLVIGDPPPGGTVSYAYNLNLPEIEVNQTIECFGVFSTHFQSGTREVNWNIRNTFDTDPVTSNNTQAVIFGTPPKSVPINNFYLLIVLLVSVIFIGNHFFKKRII